MYFNIDMTFNSFPNMYVEGPRCIDMLPEMMNTIMPFRIANMNDNNAVIFFFLNVW